MIAGGRSLTAALGVMLLAVAVSSSAALPD